MVYIAVSLFFFFRPNTRFVGQKVISSQLAQLTGTPKRYAAGAYVGSELAPTEPVDKVVAPIKQGQVHDWDAYEGLLTHVLFNELGSVKGQSPPVLYIEPHRTSKGDRETYAQVQGHWE